MGVKTEALAAHSEVIRKAPAAAPEHLLPPIAAAPTGAGTPPAMSDGVEVRRAEAVAAAPVKPGAEPISSSTMNEVIVEPLKKTWVTIRKGRPDSPPVFEDFLYPGDPPLKLHGTKFFVEVRDQTAVQIRKNGNPIAYQAPGISIQ